MWPNAHKLTVLKFMYCCTCVYESAADQMLTVSHYPFQTVMLLNETNRFTEKPINRLMAVNISNASFVWDSLEIQEKDQKKNKKEKMKKMKKDRSRRPL